MFDILGGLVMRVLQFYVWTVGLGLVVLGVIMLAECATDLIRDRRPWRTSRSSVPRINA